MEFKNRIFLIRFRDIDYDEYKGFVVIASDEKRAWDIVAKEYPSKDGIYNNIRIDNIEENKPIGETELKEGIVFSSYNAG